MDQDYLLTDEQYLALVQREFAEKQPPADEIMNRRIWQKLAKKSKRPWALGGMIAAVAACLLILYRPAKEPEFKSGHDAIGISLTWESAGRLHVTSKGVAQFAIYGASSMMNPQRLSEAKAIKADETQNIDLDAQALNGLQKVCVVAAATAQDLQNLEKMMDLVWSQLPEGQCQSL